MAHSGSAINRKPFIKIVQEVNRETFLKRSKINNGCGGEERGRQHKHQQHLKEASRDRDLTDPLLEIFNRGVRKEIRHHQTLQPFTA